MRRLPWSTHGSSPPTTSCTGCCQIAVDDAHGVDDTLDPEAVHAVAEWFEPTEELWREAGVIGPRVPVPDDADEQTRMLAMFGRAV